MVAYDHVNMNLVHLINYIYKREVSDELTRKIENCVNETKRSKEEARNFMTLQEKMNDIFAEGKLEGIAEGKAEGEKTKAISIAKSSLNEGISEQIVEISTKLSKEEIQKIKDELTKK